MWGVGLIKLGCGCWRAHGAQFVVDNFSRGLRLIKKRRRRLEGSLLLLPILIPCVQGSGFRVQGSGFRVQGSGFRVLGSGFWVQGLKFGVWVWGSGFRGKQAVHIEFRD